MRAPTETWVTPPEPSSLPVERAQVAYSSRSIAFADDGARLLRAWGAPDRPWVVGIEARGHRWKVEAWGAGPAEARQAARELFSLDHPLRDFYALVRREPVLRGTERRFRGLRLPRDASVYEALLHAIIGQQLSVRVANTIHRRLFEQVGSYLDAGGVSVPCVPTPARLGGLAPDVLRSVGMSRAKATSLHALAMWAAGEPTGTHALAAMPLPEAVDRLDALPGVGRWTAENALLRGVGRRDVFVAGDLGIRVALERFGAVRRARPEAEARAWADRHYPGWGSYATLYLWRKLVTERADSGAGESIVPGVLARGKRARVR
ncbi:MAG: DNA-3-methyladenine glycosylase family protein [Thermoplasmata archaeon]